MKNNVQINQDDINKAVWAACDTFRGVISADTYKDFILTMLFLKYISDVYKDEYNKLITQYGDNPDLIHAMMSKQRFVLPEGASFWDLYENPNFVSPHVIQSDEFYEDIHHCCFVAVDLVLCRSDRGDTAFQQCKGQCFGPRCESGKRPSGGIPES